MKEIPQIKLFFTKCMKNENIDWDERLRKNSKFTYNREEKINMIDGVG